MAVYPADGGQDQRIGAALAKRIGGYAVWVSLHDDDVFAYAVWKAGKRLDEYNSCPDYFGNVTAAVRKRTAGNPAAFADLLPEGVTPDTVKRDLIGDDTAQLEAFARHLRLPNVLTSYDYLMDGETEDVPEQAPCAFIVGRPSARRSTPCRPRCSRSHRKPLNTSSAATE